MKLTRYLAVFALPLTLSLVFASPALADDEFCIVLDKTVLENIDPSLLGESANITVAATVTYAFSDSTLPAKAITATNTAACFTISNGGNWAISVSNTRGDKFVLGVYDPIVGELEVLHLNTEIFFNGGVGDLSGAPGFAGVQFGKLSVASVQKGDDGVYRVIMTGSLIEEIIEIEKAAGKP